MSSSRLSDVLSQFRLRPIELNMRSFRVAVLVQYAGLIAAFISWFYPQTRAFMAGPIPNEYYTHTWGFQLTVGLLYLAGALVFLTFLVCVEAGLIDLYRFVRARLLRPRDPRSN
jgi:hypothetical protein